MRILFGFILFLLLPPLPPTHAWDDGGHMLVAQIAYERMHPEARRQASEFAARLVNPEAPDQKYNFATAACWMDDVRRAVGKEGLRNLHFVNRTCDGHDPEGPHALTALRDFEAVLRDPAKPVAERVEALACLLHLVGDVHQPLHAIDRERGGNDFPISGMPELWLTLAENGQPVTETNPGKYQRLHAFWDFAYRYDVPPSPELEIKLFNVPGRWAQPEEKRLKQFAQALQRFLPADKAVQQEMNASRWVAESNAIACSFAFNTPRTERPSHEYVRRAHDEACRRLALAGVRLAALLNRIFVARSVTPDH